MENPAISYIIPCYCSAATIGDVVMQLLEVTARAEGAYRDARAQILLVNDASPDDGKTWEAIRALAAAHPEVEGISLARNFGQHAALMAGLNAAKGETIVCLDDDGQTPPEEIPKLLSALEEGADAVYARYRDKQHSAARNFGTALNEWMAKVLIGKPAHLYVSSFFAVKRVIAEEMIRYTGAYPYVVGLLLRATDNVVNVDVEHKARLSGKSGYTFGKLFSLWLNGFTAFSIKPLRIATVSGGVFAFLGLIYAIYTIVKKFVNPDVPLGFSALMCAIVIIGGMVMLMLGMVGEYLGRLYITANHSPQYVVRETTKDDHYTG